MSHVLRSAVAATSLFTCTACATTGSFDQTTTVPAGEETTTVRSVSSPASAPAPAPSQASALRSVGAVPQAQAVARGQAPGQSRGDGTSTLLAWEQSRSGGPPPPKSDFHNLTFESSNSRLRIVLDMRDFAPGPVGRVALASSEALSDMPVWPEGSAAVWPAPPATDSLEEVPDSDPPREPLDSIIDGPVSPTLPSIEPQAAPEPGTLALAVIGLGMAGWHCRRIVRRSEFSA